jgi:hypothetical protein
VSVIAAKQNAFKFKIVPHKQKFIVIFSLAGRCPHPRPAEPFAQAQNPALIQKQTCIKSRYIELNQVVIVVKMVVPRQASKM